MRHARQAAGDPQAASRQRSQAAICHSWHVSFYWPLMAARWSLLVFHGWGNALILIGRGERIRTSDPLLPKQMRYQAALRPDFSDCIAGQAPLRHGTRAGARRKLFRIAGTLVTQCRRRRFCGADACDCAVSAVYLTGLETEIDPHPERRSQTTNNVIMARGAKKIAARTSPINARKTQSRQVWHRGSCRCRIRRA